MFEQPNGGVDARLRKILQAFQRALKRFQLLHLASIERVASALL
jgi:hypothetical protein